MESGRARARVSPIIQRPSKKSERGTALVEFAMSVIITFVLIFGMIDFARAIYSYHFISNAAREATRFASVRGALCSSSASPCPAAAADIQNYVLQIAPLGIDQTQITVTPTWPTPVYPPFAARRRVTRDARSRCKCRTISISFSPSISIIQSPFPLMPPLSR